MSTRSVHSIHTNNTTAATAATPALLFSPRIQVHAIPTVLAWLNRELRRNILPLLADLFMFDPTHVRLRDAFIVKYEAGKQSRLPTHVDESLFSFTVLLNDPLEFDGGGTFFEAIGGAVAGVGKGGMVSFSGRVRHGGVGITRGTRYILAAFLHLRVPCAA